MKKANLLFMMLLASITAVLSSCSTENTGGDKDVKEITLAVSGNNGLLITVPGLDVTKEVMIQATEIVDRDIEVTLVTDATDGSATLNPSTAVIKKGTDNVKVNIIFAASNFPKGTSEKAIKVTASTNAPQVVFSPDNTTFNVRGSEGVMVLAKLTASSDLLEINTADQNGVAVLNFSLSKALDKDITLDCTYAYAKDFVGTDDVLWSQNPVVIPKGSVSTQLRITVPKERKGSMPINIACADASVEVVTESINFNFIVKENPNPVASITTATDVVNVADQDVVKTIDVKLTKVSDKDVVVKLNAVSNNTLNATLAATSVTFAAGETSKTVDITFPASVFVKNALAKITVTATSDDVEVKPAASSLLFKVSGPSDRQDGQVQWAVWYDFGDDIKPLEGNLQFPKSYEKQGFMRMTIYSEVKNPAFDDNFFFDPAITFEPVLTGSLTAEDIVFEDGYELIYPDTNYGYCNFLVKKSAIGKEGTIDFVSNGTTFIATQAPCKIKVVSVQ